MPDTWCVWYRQSFMLQLAHPNPNNRKEMLEAKSLAVSRKYFSGQKLTSAEKRFKRKDDKRALGTFIGQVCIVWAIVLPVVGICLWALDYRDK